MPQLFPRSANTLVRLAFPCALLGIGAIAWAAHAVIFSPYATGVNVPIEQPVPFSHEHHVGGLGIDCRYCHTGVETSAFAGIPPTETCMTCHSQIWRDAPVLAPVRESWATGKPLRWNRVHDLPDYVYFNHSIHVQKGVACVTCHGRVDQMPLMAKQHTLYMRWCVDCHRAPEKYLRPREQVFNMRYEPPVNNPMGKNDIVFGGKTYSDQASLGDALKDAYKVRSVKDITSCNTCHR